MGANPTQAQGVCLFLIGFVLISAGLAANVSAIALIAGLVAIGASIALFLKCKPWEHNEE
jgi:hypothetical protein